MTSFPLFVNIKSRGWRLAVPRIWPTCEPVSENSALWIAAISLYENLPIFGTVHFAEAGNAMYKALTPAWAVGASQAAADKIVIDIQE
jgi:hypothetical protein